MAQIHAAIFDAYGALLDIRAAMARHAGPPDANSLRSSDQGLPWAILLNGQAGMPADAIRSTKPHDLLDFVLTVEAGGIFKSDQCACRLVTGPTGLAAPPHDLGDAPLRTPR